MTPLATKALIAAGAALTAALIWFAPGQGEQAVSEPAKGGGNVPKLRPVAAVTSPLDTAAKAMDPALKGAQDRGSLNQKEAELLFARSTWVVLPPPPPPAPAPPPPPPPPPPTAPPLPYVFMGKFEQGDSQVVIMTRGNRVVTASQGDVLENLYRVDRIEASKVTFTYLPLGTSQSLSTGGSQ